MKEATTAEALAAKYPEQVTVVVTLTWRKRRMSFRFAG